MKKSVGTCLAGGGWPMSVKCWIASGSVPKNREPPLRHQGKRMHVDNDKRKPRAELWWDQTQYRPNCVVTETPGTEERRD